jgi:hypothetical protein
LSTHSKVHIVHLYTLLQNKKINVTGTGTEQGKSYVAFVRNNMDIIAKRISDDLWVLNVMEVGHRGKGNKRGNKLFNKSAVSVIENGNSE